MFHDVEGEWDEVMDVIKACTLRRLRGGLARVSVVIKVDYRPGVTDALRAKVETIERHLGRPQA